MEDQDYVDYTDVQDTLSKLAQGVNGSTYPGVTVRTRFREFAIFDIADSLKLHHRIQATFNVDVPIDYVLSDSNVVICATRIFLESI